MKIRFFAALLLAALSMHLLSGCAVAAATKPQPQAKKPALTNQSIPNDPAPLSPAPEAAAPAVTAPNRTLISKDDAIAIALKDAGFTADQVTRLRADFDYDDGRPEYDVDFHQGGYEYDYEIHAETGKILSRGKDRED